MAYHRICEQTSINDVLELRWKCSLAFKLKRTCDRICCDNHKKAWKALVQKCVTVVFIFQTCEPVHGDLRVAVVCGHRKIRHLPRRICSGNSCLGWLLAFERSLHPHYKEEAVINIRGLHSSEVSFLLLTQRPWVRIRALLRFFLLLSSWKEDKSKLSSVYARDFANAY